MSAVLEREQALPIPATAAPTPMGMLQIAVQRGASMDELAKLMDLQERWEKNEARKAFVVAMAAFKANPPKILKSKQVNIPGGARFAHATLADVCDGVCAALGEHGLSHKWETSQENARITVTCTITHELGHAERTSLTASPDDSGKKNSIQQIASTVTYLERYTLMAACGLAAKDMDDDARGATAKPVEVDQAGKAALEACGSLDALRTAWKALTGEQRKTLGAVAEECRERIQAAEKAAQ